MKLKQNLQHEPVSTLALRKPVTASRDVTIREAIERMRQAKLGCTVIVDPTNKPLGIFTESMLTQLLARDPALVDDRLENHMAEHWPRVRMTDPISDVLEALHLKNMRFLCVVDEHDRLVGLTGQKGLMEYVADHFPEQVAVQRIGGAPFQARREGA